MIDLPTKPVAMWAVFISKIIRYYTLKDNMMAFLSYCALFCTICHV